MKRNLLKSSFWAFVVAVLIAFKGIRYSFFGDATRDFFHNFKRSYFTFFYHWYYGNGAGYYSWQWGEHGSCGPARLFKRKPKLKKWKRRLLNDLLFFPLTNSDKTIRF